MVRQERTERRNLFSGIRSSLPVIDGRERGAVLLWFLDSAGHWLGRLASTARASCIEEVHPSLSLLDLHARSTCVSLRCTIVVIEHYNGSCVVRRCTGQLSDESQCRKWQ